MKANFIRQLVIFCSLPLAAVLKAEVPVPGLQQQISPAEYAALVDLYASTQGQHWALKQGWTDPAAPVWDGVTVSGFEYDSSSGQLLRVGHVIALALGNNGLRGPLPESLGNLVELQSLNFPFNSVTSIPESLGNLVNLQRISLLDNSVSGTIPDSVGNLVNLQALDLTGNQLSGSIPGSIGNMAKLESLRLGGNQLGGSIPESLGDLANLRLLHLWVNQLSGSIPESLGNLANLEELIAESNQLSGNIPKSLGHLVNIKTLDFAANRLSGNIPESLGNLATLQSLSLVDNQLSGSIPDSLGNLAQLQGLDLRGNQLSGSIPGTFHNLLNLGFLGLGDNRLTGAIPESLADLANLAFLALGDNQLTGTIPESLGNLVNLQRIYVQHNSLNGNIPVSFDQLVNLRELWLDGNQLSGSIPATFDKLASLEILSAESNQLSGGLPDFSVLPNLYYVDLVNNCFDISPGSQARAIIDRLLAEGKAVGYDPQNQDCVPLTLGCPANLTVPADAGQCSAVVNYPSPTTSSGSGDVAVVCQPPSGSLLPNGVNSVACVATYASGVQASCSFTVQVQDLEPPSLEQVTANPSVLWPPNHQIVPVTLGVAAADNCGPTTCKIVSVSSNEPDGGLSNGNQGSDWELTGDLTLNLRAERTGKAADRVYTVMVECRDAAGNASQTPVTVTAPRHRQSK